MAIWDFDYSSISSITRLLEENGLGMTKKFGQNFLVSMSALDRITALSGACEGMRVWEVGPGIGALTTKLLQTGAEVTAFEIDHGFCRILREQAYVDVPNFKLVEGDALKNWKTEWETQGTPDIICANLPYNVGSIFIASVIENRCLPQTMVFTLQSEVVDRICAKQTDDAFSGFSILTGIDYENTDAMRLRSGCFFPSPNVDSSVVVMRKRENPLVPDAEARDFLELVRILFAQRRKTVKNNLKATGKSSADIDRALTECGISQTERAEKLSVWQILALKRSLQG
ncbi:MAG: 16S rRNA (adenine(1518)-N(6)/adenine(1519)-N(6))-dimethyltransferase RsmA [Sphaerochaetaceae bacterium]|nr:ribosomal RNA small subunit methyltransferase A [Spirochaetales bacterium]MBQ7282456.1 ribosomal RNA small subunit methyltransferase A [Spirochaetales bacterium]MBR6235888.1 ribosomal RNA small subunit methyltransferase A [Spirochaetales bacterium]MCR5443866.1 16S rRNA (adenine(1518)-N(6)/adenine(1519)-N(6))-dimethyltransferase RsmA [Sphaerochaetaceae bacterium]